MKGLQFLHLSEAQQSRGERSAIAETRYLERSKGQPEQKKKPRSQSLSIYDNSRMDELWDRMRYTESAIEGAHKGNLRGRWVQDVFPTFEDLFINLPEPLAFNVEASESSSLQDAAIQGNYPWPRISHAMGI